MGLWARLKESWGNNGSYRSDYYRGEKGSGKHTHDYYKVSGNGKVTSGAVKTNESSGSHTSTGKIR